MASETNAVCGLCGEPMAEGEVMFKYHGYSGPCPKPPLPKKRTRKPQIVWMPETNGGHLWIQHAGDTRKAAVASWCAGSSWSWAQWRKERPALRVVKVQLVPVPAAGGE